MRNGVPIRSAEAFALRQIRSWLGSNRRATMIRRSSSRSAKHSISSLRRRIDLDKPLRHRDTETQRHGEGARRSAAPRRARYLQRVLLRVFVSVWTSMSSYF